MDNLVSPIIFIGYAAPGNKIKVNFLNFEAYYSLKSEFAKCGPQSSSSNQQAWYPSSRQLNSWIIAIIYKLKPFKKYHRPNI